MDEEKEAPEDPGGLAGDDSVLGSEGPYGRSASGARLPSEEASLPITSLGNVSSCLWGRLESCGMLL